MTFLVVTLEAGRNLAMSVMTGGTGDLGVVLGISLGYSLVDLGMTRVLMAVATVFLGGIFGVSNDHGFMRTGMTGQTYLRFNSNKVVWSAPFLTMTAQAARDESVLGVTVGARQVCVLAGEFFQLLWRATVAI